MNTSLGARPWELTGFWPNDWYVDRGRAPLFGPIPARVPGGVQEDLRQAGLLEDLNVGLNSLGAEWVEHRQWVYRTTFATPDHPAARQFLEFDGLDWSGHVFLNGQELQAFHGMFLVVRLEVTGRLAGPGAPNDLAVVFDPPPDVDGQVGRSSQVRVVKSRFNYRWDWCPRIVPVGIWDDVRLVTTGPVRLVGPYVSAGWSSDLQAGELACQVFLEGAGSETARVQVGVRPCSLTAGATVWEGEATGALPEMVPPLGNGLVRRALRATLPQALPWWPNGYGAQPRYAVTVRVSTADGTCSDEVVLRTGFRDVRWLPNPGAPGDALPYTCLCNGRRVFLQGVNWIPPRPVYGAVADQEYRSLLTRFGHMGCTLIRVNGVSIIEKEAFYDACDELGLLVWQDLIQSSSHHINGMDSIAPDEPEVLGELERVAEEAARRRRHHPSLAAWCGGNELRDRDNVHPVPLTHPNPTRLQAALARQDPGRAFFPSTPSGPSMHTDLANVGRGLHHEVHGPWTHLGDPEHYAFWNEDDALMRMEVGAPGAARLEVLQRIAGQRFSLWPADRSNALWMHHGEWWIPWPQLSRLFGPWDRDRPELASFLACSRYLQAEALRYAISAMRRREPSLSGINIWCGNEPFANAANCSLLEYDGRPKPVCGVLERTLAPVHASCRYERIAFRPGIPFTATVFLHVREIGEPPAGSRSPWRVDATLYTLRGDPLARRQWQIPASGAGPSVAVGEINWQVEAVPEDVFLLRVAVAADGEAAEASRQETYVFTSTEGPSLAPLRHLPAPELSVRAPRDDREHLDVRNGGEVAAIAVHLDVGDDHATPNDFTLLPGEGVRVAVLPSQGGERPHTVTAEVLPGLTSVWSR